MRLREQSGFSLAEMLVATAIAAFGLAGVAALIGTGVQLQGNARASTIGVNLAVAELERLRTLPLTSVELTVGGSLTANTANHFAIRSQTTVRWQIANGPACGVPTWGGPGAAAECGRAITVVAIPANLLAGPTTVAGMLWR